MSAFDSIAAANAADVARAQRRRQTRALPQASWWLGLDRASFAATWRDQVNRLRAEDLRWAGSSQVVGWREPRIERELYT